MSKFRRKGKGGSPAISTASLPDIVFMLLFFFMVTTVMREVDLLVEIQQPQASEIQKIDNKSLVNYIYIGPPIEADKYGNEARIQLDDAFAETKDIRPYIEKRRSEVDEKLKNKLTTSLKVDKKTKMGTISDVKQELRESYALKLLYSTLDKGKN